MNFDVDLFVIGAGSGGVRAARIAAGHGAKTMVAEEFRIGGTCVIRGCVPKKLLVYASRFADAFHDAKGFGWSVGETHFHWPALVAAKEKEITRLSHAYRVNLEAAGGELTEQRAFVAGAHLVRLADGREISARHILVATGARPELLPGVEGIEHAITSNEAFDLEKFPRRLLVVGGGYIAVEFASLFRRLGAEVIQVLRADNILRGFDEDMRVGLRDEMVARGREVQIWPPAQADRKAQPGPDRRTRPTASGSTSIRCSSRRGESPIRRGWGSRRRASRSTLRAPWSSMPTRPRTCLRSTRSATSPTGSI